MFFRYLLTCIRKSNHKSNNNNVSVKSLQLPEWVHSYEAGYSLDRWRNKKPRLRGRTAPARRIDILQIPESTCSTNETHKDDTTDLDIQNIPAEEDLSEYDINSDIEELFRRSQRYEEDKEERYERKKKDKSQRHSKKKRKSRRTVRYSLSKPASPETEQIIRVDVTSSIPLDDLEEPAAISELITYTLLIYLKLIFFQLRIPIQTRHQ